MVTNLYELLTQSKYVGRVRCQFGQYRWWIGFLNQQGRVEY